MFERIAIVGVGLIGGSIARAAARTWPAVEITCIEAGQGIEAVAGAELVVLAAPVLANIARLTELPPHLAPGAIVTDVSSTKSPFFKRPSLRASTSASGIVAAVVLP